MPLPLGVDQLHGRPALGGEEPRDDAAVVGGHRPGAVIALDGAVGIEDVDEELLRRMDRHPGQLRPHFPPFAGMGVALAALLLEERLAARHVTTGEDDREDFVDHLLPVGARQAAPLGDHLPGALADRAVGMLGELSPFHQRHISDGDRTGLEPVDELGGPVPVGKHRAEGGITDGRRERGELVEDQPGGFRRRRTADRRDNPRRKLRARAAANPLEQLTDQLRIGRAKRHEPFGGLDPLQILSLGPIEIGQERLADLADMAVEGPAARVLDKRHQLPLRRGGKPVDQRHDRFLRRRVEGGGLPLRPSAREPFERRRGRGGVGLGKLEEHAADSLGIPPPGHMLGDAADEREQLRRRRSDLGHKQRRQQRRRSEPGRLRRLAVEQRRENPGSLDRRGARGSIGKDRVGQRARILKRANDKLSGEVERRALGERLENG